MENTGCIQIKAVGKLTVPKHLGYLPSRRCTLQTRTHLFFIALEVTWIAIFPESEGVES